MSSRRTEKQIFRELKRISEGIPKELLENLMTKEVIGGTVTDLLKKAIALPDGEMDMTPEKRERFQLMLDSGVLDREVEVLNKDTEKLIDAYYDAEIALAVKLGRLPKDAPMPALIRKKGKKYARKQHARLKELYNPEAHQEDPGGNFGEDSGGDRPLGDHDPVREPPGEYGD